MIKKENCKIVFSDGETFLGYSLCYKTNFFTEVVFNTSNLGYEEIISDPSYANQTVVFTTPHIGNTGITLFDLESNRVWLSCLIIRNLYSGFSENFKFNKKILEFLLKNKVVLLNNFDTRSITKKITEGKNHILILHNRSNKLKQIFKKKIDKIPYIKYTSTNLNYITCTYKTNKIRRAIYFTKKVIVVDFGLKKSIIENLVVRNILPYVINYRFIKNINFELFNGVVLTNGPGNPKIYKNIIKYINTIGKNKTIFSICLGHQFFFISKGKKIKKLKYGHHGSNHPIFYNNKCYISSQNHNYFCKKKTKIYSLFDKTNQGIKTKKNLSFQGHPEACPGPKDLIFLFDIFKKQI
ncbi:carbamoyl phosphate synthase small subunit [Candidatus Vidania fulgoroideorum]